MRVALLIVVVLICVCALLSGSRPVPAPRVQTLSSLKLAYYTTQTIEEEKRIGIVEQLQRMTNAGTLQNRWVKLMLAAASEDHFETNLAFKQWCNDGYGHLLNVEFRTNLIARGASPKLTNIDLPVIIWSSGANGRDELGFGDDIGPLPDWWKGDGQR